MGMHFSGMSEVFWESSENLYEDKSALMEYRAASYTKAAMEEGAPILNCGAFTDCTKIQMGRPGVGLLYKEAHIWYISAFNALSTRASHLPMV